MSRARHACVIGWPIGHSRSPLIHGHWLERYGIEGTYTRLAVPPAELTAFFDGLRARGLAGCNVTVPHKEPVFHLADHVTEEARCVGAANTLWLEGDRLHATNTDTYGFLSQLDAAAPGWSVAGVPVVLLGAGGAARAVLHGLLQRGCREVRVVNRTLAKAQALRPRGRARRSQAFAATTAP